MPEELGKIERPEAAQFKTGRKLYFVPLVFEPVMADDKVQSMFNRYWDQALSQLRSLQDKLGPAKKLYHELIAEAGENGREMIEQLNPGSFRTVKESTDKGTELVAVEDGETLDEFMDWGKCLGSGLRSQAVFKVAYEAYVKAQEKRNEFIVKRIDATLGKDEAGIFIMREGHRLQFPGDIQIFYISPPALDEVRRWAREQEESAHKHEHE